MGAHPAAPPPAHAHAQAQLATHAQETQEEYEDEREVVEGVDFLGGIYLYGLGIKI